MRRLYSTFAGGWPGTALLLMRVVLGASLLLRANSTVWSNPPVTTTVVSAFLAGSGLLLIPGLWTPIVGALVALLDDKRGPMGHGLARNHWFALSHVRTGPLVCRCSHVWVEAHAISIAQNQRQLLKDSFINHRNLWLDGGSYFPSLEFPIYPVVGLFASEIR